MKTQIKLTVLYDNNPLLNKLQTDWGFSCLIETDSSALLFDMGDNGKILLDNMKNLGIDQKRIDSVFLSHYHHDHTGGLKEFLYANPNVKVFYPASFQQELADLIKRMNALPVPVSDFTEIMPDLFSLGVIDGTIPEQSLAIRSQNGIIIITGCAHPGIINILQKAKDKFPEELIYLALGGFHLHRLNEEEINDVIQKIYDMDLLNVAPTHCTGNTARSMFKEVFDADYIEVGIGKEIKIE
ncbi:MAG: MBL fold metallo-hydrolase [Melioribacteraceae bacterium]|nr:MBL fold metallo-hydrolase [Melioribacteraceae bacterium]